MKLFTHSFARTVFLLVLGSAVCTGCVHGSMESVQPLNTVGSGAFSIDALANFRYTIVSPLVRSVWSSSDTSFSVKLDQGKWLSPRPSSVAPFNIVRLDSSLITQGDLNADGVEDVVTALTIGESPELQTEVVAFTLKDGSLSQLASFPIGALSVTDLDIEGDQLVVQAKYPQRSTFESKSLRLTFSL